MREFKNYKAAINEAGEITGFFSTYNDEPDCYGDVVAPGAFTKTIKAREATGHPFPFCWNHDLDQIIGEVKKIEDTEKGPQMTAGFFDFPLAQEKRALAMSGVVYQFSFAYEVKDYEEIKFDNGYRGRLLKEVELFEISLVPVPANPSAEMTDVKSGKRNSKADEGKLQAAIDAINDAIADATEELEKALGYLLELIGEEKAPEEEEKTNDENSAASEEEVAADANSAEEEQKADDNSGVKAELLTYISEFKRKENEHES